MIRPDPSPKALLSALPRRLHEAVFAQGILRPEAPCLSDATGAWNFAQLCEAVQNAADWLANIGVRGGDRVFLVTENCREAAALLLACSLLDAWAVLVNARLSAGEIDGLLDRSSPALVCAVLASVQSRAHAARLSLATLEVPGLGRIAAGSLREYAASEPVEHDSNQVAVLIYTSGSSGEPKGVMLTHKNLLYMAAVSGAIRALNPTDRLLGVLPISHSVGLSVVFLGALMHGASVHLVLRFSPPAFLAALAKDRITVVLGAPALLSLLLDYATQRGIPTAEAPDLRIISVSGAPLDLKLKQSAETFFQLPLHHGYGITECGPTIAQIRPGAERADCSVGTLLPGLEARLVGPDGTEVPPGEAGELILRSPSVMRGYFRDPARTAEVLDADGWFRTGDLARLEASELTVVGRAKDLIIRFGFNVVPAEVEAVLEKHEAVLQAAVVGRPCPEGEEIWAFVVPRTGMHADIPALAQHAASHLASYKRPSRITIVSSLPTTPTGKILKRDLLALEAA